MRTVTITLGRNVGSDPMPADTWRSFHQAARSLVDTADGDVWADTTYRGRWGDFYEDAAIIYGQVPDDLVPSLGDALAALAATYGQEAIGYSIGDPGLVGPGS